MPPQIDPSTGERIAAATAQIDPQTGERIAAGNASSPPVPFNVRAMMAVGHKPTNVPPSYTAGSIGREAALGFASGAGIPESQSPVSDLASSLSGNDLANKARQDLNSGNRAKGYTEAALSGMPLVGPLLNSFFTGGDALAAQARKSLANGNKGTAFVQAVASGTAPIGPALYSAGNDVVAGIKQRDPNLVAHGVGSGLGTAATLLTGKEAPAAADAAIDAAKVPEAIKRLSIPEMTGTTPERIAQLKTFPKTVETIRQTAVNAEKQAHAAASAKFPQFKEPIPTGKMLEVPAEGPMGVDDWGEHSAKTMMPETTTFRQLQEQRSKLLADMADEKQAINRGATPRFDLARMSNHLDSIDAVMDKAALDQGGPQGLAQLQKARKQYGQYMQDFHAPGSSLRGLLDAKPNQTPAVVNKLLAPDGARTVETLRKYGVNTGTIENMLGSGDRPVRVAMNESSKLRKIGSDDAYTAQRLQESLSQTKVNELPSSAQARLPAWAMRSKWPSVIGEVPGANILNPRRITQWRIEQALKGK